MFENVEIRTQPSDDFPEGELKDESWLLKRYGDLLLYPATINKGWRLVKVQEQEGPTSCCVQLLNEDGTPYTGGACGWWYSTADPMPQCSPGEWPPEMTPKHSGVSGRVDGNGIIGFALSKDSWFLPPAERGPYAVWPCAPQGQGQMLWGIGMARNADGSYTDHRHLNLWFQWQEGTPEPPPPPSGDFEESVLAYLETITDSICVMVDFIEKIQS